MGNFISINFAPGNTLLTVLGIVCGILLLPTIVSAEESSIPWQCTSYTYTGPSQEACIKSLADDPRQEKIASLERQIRRQQFELEKLKDRLNRQAENVLRQAPMNYPPNAYGPPPLMGIGGPWFGAGRPLGFGVGPFPFFPPLAIVID